MSNWLDETLDLQAQEIRRPARPAEPRLRPAPRPHLPALGLAVPALQLAALVVAALAVASLLF